MHKASEEIDLDELVGLNNPNDDEIAKSKQNSQQSKKDNKSEIKSNETRDLKSQRMGQSWLRDVLGSDSKKPENSIEESPIEQELEQKDSLKADSSKSSKDSPKSE